jgi:signal transduction histidine kinase
VGAAKIARDITEAKQMREAVLRLNEDLEQQASELAAQAAELEEQAAELEHRVDQSATLTTQLKQTNEELRNAVATAERAQQEAQAANRVKGDFLATMSHELRTPLNAISGYADLMDAGIHGDLPAQYRDYLDRIRKSQRHLLELISGLLDFSKLEAGKLEMKLSPVAVADIFTRVEALASPQAQAKQQTLRMERPADAIRIQADPERAVQILLNLVANAIKFTPVDGSITVSAETDDTSLVVMRVRDTGPGVVPAHADRIFEPFVQLDKSLTRDHQGAGLGLAISRDLARAMGGDVNLEYDDGPGATFALTLKRAQ